MFKNFKMMLHGMGLHSLNSFRVEIMSCNPGKFSSIILWWFSPQIFPCSFEIYFIWILYLTYWSSNFLAFSFLFPFFICILYYFWERFLFLTLILLVNFKFLPLKSFWCLIVSLERIIFYSPCCLWFSMRAREAHGKGAGGTTVTVPVTLSSLWACCPERSTSGRGWSSLGCAPGNRQGVTDTHLLGFYLCCLISAPSWVPSACQVSLSNFSFCV